MRLVLHVGMTKSGSTALQRGLHALQDRLLAQGYLYPDGQRVRHNHTFLIAAAVPPRKLPRAYRPRYGDDPALVARDLQAWLGRVRDAIARRQPKTLLLSGENLFARVSGPEEFARLGAVLRSLADTIEVVAYLRRPSEFYLASAQQILHADDRIRPVAPIAYRAPLEGYAGIADRLHVFKYDRAGFPGGDVLKHFLQAFSPEVSAGDLPRLDANVSLSIEAMAILADYNRLHHRDKRRSFAADATQLRAALAAADRDLPPAQRSRLKEGLARAIDEGSPDLLWLRDAHGVVFDGIDYARIAPMAPRRRPKRLREVCAIDPGRRAQITQHALRHLAEALVAAQATAGAAAKSRRRVRRRRKAAPRRRGVPAPATWRSALRRLLPQRP